MKQRILLLLLCLGSLLHVSCKKESVDSNVHIRVRNASSYQFQSVRIFSFNIDDTFGALSNGEETVYKAYSSFPNPARISVMLNGKELTSPQIYTIVAEPPLEPGHYTYIVSVDDLTEGRLRLTLERQ